MSDHKIFVYGSLRRGFQHPAYAYISRYFELIGEAKVKGELFDMGEYPAAVPTEQDSFISGELYRIVNDEEFAWAMAQLDDYEGVHAESGEPGLYRRELTNVYIGDHSEQAWIYWFNGDITGKSKVDSGDVLSYMQQKNQH